MSWLLAFGLTLAIEVPIYAWGLRLWIRPLRGAAVGVGVNVATHPLLWFGLAGLRLDGAPYWLITGGAEIAVVLAEAALVVAVVRPGAAGALRVSATANAASFGLGLIGSALATLVVR